MFAFFNAHNHSDNKCTSNTSNYIFWLQINQQIITPKQRNMFLGQWLCLTLLDSNFYSILYYNAVIWLTPEISAVMKQALISVSANAQRSCSMYNCAEISFERIHSLCKKCTPKQITSYQISLKLHDLTLKMLCCTKIVWHILFIIILISFVCYFTACWNKMLYISNLKN